MFERPFLSVWHSWLIFIWTFFHFPLLDARARAFFPLSLSHFHHFVEAFVFFFLFSKIVFKLAESKTFKKNRRIKFFLQSVHRWCAACTLMLMIDSMSFVDSKFALHKVHNAQYAVSGIRLKHYKITSWSNIVLFLLMHSPIYHSKCSRSLAKTECNRTHLEKKRMYKHYKRTTKQTARRRWQEKKQKKREQIHAK